MLGSLLSFHARVDEDPCTQGGGTPNLLDVGKLVSEGGIVAKVRRLLNVAEIHVVIRVFSALISPAISS